MPVTPTDVLFMCGDKALPATLCALADTCPEPQCSCMTFPGFRFTNIQVLEINHFHLCRSYVESFQEARPALKRQPRSYWGLRRGPKKAVQNAIRLAGDPFAAMREPKSKTPPPQSAKGKEKLVVDVSDDDDDMEEAGDVNPSEEGAERGTGGKRRGRYKLLQLGEMGKTCNRPPYYGTWSRKRCVLSSFAFSWSWIHFLNEHVLSFVR